MEKEIKPEEIRITPPPGYGIHEIVLRRQDEKISVDNPVDLHFTPFQLDKISSLLIDFSNITARHAPSIISLLNRMVNVESYDTEEKSPFDDCEKELIPYIDNLSRVPPVELFRRCVNIFVSSGKEKDVAEAIAKAYLDELKKIHDQEIAKKT